jgi:Fic family protein
MFVINSKDQIEYVAASHDIVMNELVKLFRDISILLQTDLDICKVFYSASMIHLVFVKIHPFQVVNGRTARLIEKWFLLEKLGKKANAIQLEKQYYNHRNNYYSNLKKLGIEYLDLDYSKSLDFLLLTVQSIAED